MDGSEFFLSGLGVFCHKGLHNDGSAKNQPRSSLAFERRTSFEDQDGHLVGETESLRVPEDISSS